jgi:hypothetical protein
MYHPAAALRQASLHETMQRDMAAIPETLLRARAARAQERVGIAVAPEASEPAREDLTPAATSAVPPPSAMDLGVRTSDDQLGLF